MHMHTPPPPLRGRTVLIHQAQPARLAFERRRAGHAPGFQQLFVEQLLDGYLDRAGVRVPARIRQLRGVDHAAVPV